MKSRSIGLVAIIVGSLACSSKSEAPVTSPETAALLTVRTSEWTKTDLGVVAAVTEHEGTVAVFGDRGVKLMITGVVAVSEESTKAWLGAATISSADGRGVWIVGIDGGGKLLRVRGDPASLEDVSDRYGLIGRKISSIAAVSTNVVAIGYDGGFAVADGTNVEHWKDPSFAKLVGGKGRVAAIAADGIHVYEVASKKTSLYPLAGAAFVAIDANGKVVAATKREIYLEAEGVLKVRHKETADVHGLVASGTRVWFAAGTELGVLSGGAVSRSKNAAIPVTATLLGSPSGDVWALDTGKLAHWTIDSGGGVKEQAWDATMRPIFARSCSKCHLPGGEAGIDLSSYKEWSIRLDKLEDYIVLKKSMPPAGNPFDDADRTAVKDWIASERKK